MARYIKTFAFALSLIGLFMGGDSHPELAARTAGKEKESDLDITKMYQPNLEVFTYATTSTNTLKEYYAPTTEQCYSDVVDSVTSSGCEFSRGYDRNHCSGTFTKDGQSKKFNGMDVTCDDPFDDYKEPLKTHEQIIFQVAVNDGLTRVPPRTPMCAVFNITYLSGYERIAESHLPEEERHGRTPDYALRATTRKDLDKTPCWEKLQEISRQTDKTITTCLKTREIPFYEP